MALPQTVGFKAEAVNEEGIWCLCTVKDVSNDAVNVSFDGWNAEWNCRIYVTHARSEIERYRIIKERKKAINVKSQGKWQIIS